MFQPSPVLWYIRKALNSILLTYNEYRQPQLTILILYLQETAFTVPVPCDTKVLRWICALYPPFSANFSAYLTFHPLLRKRIALHDRTILIQPLAGVWGGAPTHGRPVRKPLKPHPLQNFISNARWKCAGSGTASRRGGREDSPAVRGKCHEVTKGDGPRAARSPCRGVGQSPALTG